MKSRVGSDRGTTLPLGTKVWPFFSKYLRKSQWGRDICSSPPGLVGYFCFSARKTGGRGRDASFSEGGRDWGISASLDLLDEGLANLHGAPLRLVARGGGHSAYLGEDHADRGGVCARDRGRRRRRGFRGVSRNSEVEQARDELAVEASHAACLSRVTSTQVVESRTYSRTLTLRSRF